MMAFILNIMIVSEIFYGVKCNRCGEQYEDGEHSFWSDESGAVENAMESEWIEEKGKHYCSECYEQNEETEENTVKPDFPEHVKNLKKFFDKIIVGHSSSILEQEDCLKISKTLYNQTGLNSYDTNYITEITGASLISIDIKKHERWSGYEAVVLVRR
jgi:hypothetical protein